MAIRHKVHELLVICNRTRHHLQFNMQMVGVLHYTLLFVGPRCTLPKEPHNHEHEYKAHG